MKTRCLNQNYRDYRYHGGRGIGVCERWSGSDGFANFIADMGPRPSPCHSLDRIDNNGSYSPDNCRWATRQEQMRNKRNNHILTLGGSSRTIVEWAEVTGLTEDAIERRINLLGWSVEEALTLPLGTHRG